ncbi:MAG: hypothetical protein GXY92_11090 [Syntrophomonadaceae bacterium]|nr:hypothetical protein [Syntrophomonadaceae bacterium]
MSLFYFFVQGIPECMGMVALTLAYARVPLRWGFIFIAAVLLAVVNYLIRSLPFTFGFHIPVMMFINYFLIIKFTKSTLSRTILAVFSGLATVAFVEFLVSNTSFALINRDPQDIIADERLWAIIGIVQAAILNMIALFVARVMKPLEGAWRNELPGIQQKMGE